MILDLGKAGEPLYTYPHYGRHSGEAKEVHQARKYSPNKITSQEVRVVSGDPDPERISTSYVERHNLCWAP